MSNYMSKESIALKILAIKDIGLGFMELATNKDIDYSILHETFSYIIDKTGEEIDASINHIENELKTKQNKINTMESSNGQNQLK